MKLALFIVTLVCVVFAKSQLSTDSPQLRTYVAPIQAVQVVQNAPSVPPVYCVDHLDICDALHKVGFPEDQVRIMMAVGQAESSLRQNAKGDISLMNAKWNASFGIWQVRCLNNPGSQWWRDVNFVTASLYNQAKAAYAISGYGKGRFSPWSTWRSGAYKRFLK